MLLTVELITEEWMDVQEAISQVGHILEQELKNDPHVEYVDCDMLMCGKVDDEDTNKSDKTKEVA